MFNLFSEVFLVYDNIYVYGVFLVMLKRPVLIWTELAISTYISLCLAHVFTYSNWRFLIFIKNRNKSLLSLVIYRTLLSIWVYMKIWCWIARQKLSSHFKLNVKNLPCCCCQFMHCCIWPLLMKKVTFNTRPNLFFSLPYRIRNSHLSLYW